MPKRGKPKHQRRSLFSNGLVKGIILLSCISCFHTGIQKQQNAVEILQTSEISGSRNAPAWLEMNSLSLDGGIYSRVQFASVKGMCTNTLAEPPAVLHFNLGYHPSGFRGKAAPTRLCAFEIRGSRDPFSRAISSAGRPARLYSEANGGSGSSELVSQRTSGKKSELKAFAVTGSLVVQKVHCLCI